MPNLKTLFAKLKTKLKPVTAPAAESDSPNLWQRLLAWRPNNLVILGIGSTLITLLVVIVSLKLYHDSGDIYLDRSRPGFMPEETEVNQKTADSDYDFSDFGSLKAADIDELLEHLKIELDHLNDFSSEPFSPAPLSDETLGL